MPTPYLYRPIAFYQGKVLKCVSMATPASRAIVQARADGEELDADGLMINGVVVETPDYYGDRIRADDLQPYSAT